MTKLKLIIKLTTAARNKIEESSHSDFYELAENIDNIKLFYHRTKKDINEDVEGRIAFPLDNRNVLLLKKDDNENYFVAVDFWYDREVNTASKDVFELPSNIECQITDKLDRYSNDAIDLDEVLRQIRGLKPWKPYESSNIEEKKWQAYFELYKKIIGESKVDFSISDIDLKKDKLFAHLRDEDLKDKITDAKGEDVKFGLIDSKQQKRELKKLGRLQAVHTKIEINPDKNYKKQLIELISNQLESFHLEDGESPKIQLLSKEDFQKLSNKKSTQELTFYHHDNPCFKGEVCIEKPQPDKKNEESDNEHAETPADKYYINNNSIIPLQLNCFIDYFSEEYQVNVMQRCFSKVKEMPIWEVLSGIRVSKLPQDIDINFDNPKLNEEQKKAIRGAVGAEELFLIWGPPGTGKTEVIKEIAKQESMRGNQTLIVSQSNLAVDNALARIYGDGVSYPFRIAKENYELEGEDEKKVPLYAGNKPSVNIPEIFLNLLKEKVNSCDSQDNLKNDFLKDIDKAKKNLKKEKKSQVELREFEQLAKLYTDKINVVGSTLMEAGKLINRGDRKNPDWKNKLCDTTGIEEFDTVIIDEVSKATPPELFIPIPLGKKLILVGDHKQLPPMFKMTSGDHKSLEQWADEVGIPKEELDIENTIFERLWERHADEASKCRSMLTQQYRMHSKISRLITPFYTDSEGSMSDGLSDEEMDSLKIENGFFDKVAMWIGTRSHESDIGHEKKNGTSFYNKDEIEKVGKLLDKLVALKDPNMSVGVITFYGAQLGKIRTKYQREYEDKFGEGKLIFGTVDRFQGRECDVIICSLVRNNSERVIGFASKVNRINVAFSRARKCLIILGSKEQFAYEVRNKNAQEKYKYIYDNCDSVKPKELDK